MGKKSQRKNRDSLEAFLIKKLEEEGRIFERNWETILFFLKTKANIYKHFDRKP